MYKLSLIENMIGTIRYHRFMSTAAKQTPAQYCLELIRKHDYENYLCTLLLPYNVREAGIAIRAFNVEVAHVQDQTQETQIGVMRLKFWTDALNNVYNNTPLRNPVSIELHRLLQVRKKCKLSKHYFKRLIEAREDMLNNHIFLNLESLEKYSEYTVSSIYYLLLEAYGIKSIDTDHVVSHLGKAHGIVTLLRSVPYNSQKRVLVLPQDILAKNNVSTETVLQKKSNKGLNDTVYEIASAAKQHLNLAASYKKNVRKDINSICLPIVCIEAYLEELRQVDFDVFHPRLQKRNNLLPVQLLWKKLMFSLKK